MMSANSPSYRDRLIGEIHAKLDELAKLNQPWKAAWIAQAICNKHKKGLAKNDHASFWRHCGYSECRDEVRRCINRRAGDRPDRSEDGDGQQLHLPGYDHLQNYYVVTRDGDEQGISVHAMTDAELDAKTVLYRRMGAACYAHADEIDRFKRRRSPPAAVA